MPLLAQRGQGFIRQRGSLLRISLPGRKLRGEQETGYLPVVQVEKLLLDLLFRQLVQDRQGRCGPVQITVGQPLRSQEVTDLRIVRM